ncbi:unnamed protein product [Lactuca saligna]|uniref:Uncharacterized protein n=1 Tax=Lactuca saligna TaxID=75948 RepID=A0AA36EHG8_LACSI|nr:unnamed protein product [Lactuca saligna]
MIPLSTLFSKFVNTVPTKDDFPIIARMQKCTEQPYMVESSYAEEENDEENVNNDDDVDNVPQAEIAPPTLTPITIDALHQGYQEASNSNFQNFVLSQLYFIMEITRSMDKSLTKVERRLTTFERDVATMKQYMDLGVDDDAMIVVAIISIVDADATTDYQPILESGDQLETKYYEGFLDLDFMPLADVVVVPLKTIYIDSYIKRGSSQETKMEVPQGDNTNIDFDDGVQLNPRKSKASFSGGSLNTNVGSSSKVDLHNRIDRNKFGDVLTRRTKLDPIIKVRCTKPKNESLNLYLVRKKVNFEYAKVAFARQLVKIRYIEWMKILEINDKYKGIHDQEVKLEIHQLLNKVKKLNIVPSVGPLASSSRSASPGRTVTPYQSKNTTFILPYRTR